MNAPDPANGLPHLRRSGKGRQFILDGTPRLLLGGQTHNSAPSDPAHMEEVFDHVAAMHVETLIVGVSWSRTEPTEGTCDFTIVDALIGQARARGLRLVLIWFGAFKNAGSTYAPSWVRADSGRFPRAVLLPTKKGMFTYPGEMPKPVLSVFSPELLLAEQRTFVALMSHLAVADQEHTVVMVQVENESGVIHDSRDRSAAAQTAWELPVPARLMEHLTHSGTGLRPELAALWARQGNRTGGSWADVFGDDWEADEVFMAWAFASHCEALAAAGKRVKELPMYTNAWLGPQPGQPCAGDYPSGGPASRVLDVWKAAAPSLDMLSPDIYLPDVKPVLHDYAREDNALFIPEAQFRTGTLFYALGRHQAVGFSVFGVEDGLVGGQLARAYALLMPMREVIAQAQSDGRIAGILIEDVDTEVCFDLGGYAVKAQGSRDLIGKMLLDAGVPVLPPQPALPSETSANGIPPTPGDSRPLGLLIAQGPDEFLLVGQGLTLNFSHPTARVELDHAEEGRFEDGVWRPGRALNGNERLYLVPPDDLGAVRIRRIRLDGPPATT
jgi:hypothetical protein